MLHPSILSDRLRLRTGELFASPLCFKPARMCPPWKVVFTSLRPSPHLLEGLSLGAGLFSRMLPRAYEVPTGLRAFPAMVCTCHDFYIHSIRRHRLTRKFKLSGISSFGDDTMVTVAHRVSFEHLHLSCMRQDNKRVRELMARKEAESAHLSDVIGSAMIPDLATERRKAICEKESQAVVMCYQSNGMCGKLVDQLEFCASNASTSGSQ